ncbi:hypothetical protein LINPERHAP2_LOCUS42845 [Linum perenne]
MLARDERGDMVSYRAISWGGVWRPCEAECRTVLEAMSWMEHEGYSHVIFETDAKQVVDALHMSRQERTEFGDLLEACHAIMERNAGFEIQFCRREQNEAAHKIARQSIFMQTPFVGVHPPIWLTDVLLAQCSSAH